MIMLVDDAVFVFPNYLIQSLKQAIFADMSVLMMTMTTLNKLVPPLVSGLEFCHWQQWSNRDIRVYS